MVPSFSMAIINTMRGAKSDFQLHAMNMNPSTTRTVIEIWSTVDAITRHSTYMFPLLLQFPICVQDTLQQIYQPLHSAHPPEELQWQHPFFDQAMTKMDTFALSPVSLGLADDF
ncbi:unnamed protein product [Lathyrus oleraceus]